MYELKKNGKVFTSKSVGTGPSSYEKKNLPSHGLTKAEKYWIDAFDASFGLRQLSFLQVVPNRFYMHDSSLISVLHTLPIVPYVV